MGPATDPSPRLTQGSRIAVIGGGPAGSLFALAALDAATKAGIALSITVFERKDLTSAGPRGCNMCAGILSRRVVQGLEKLGIALPSSVVQDRVRVYKLHWGHHTIAIEPPDASRQVLSVYRAGGPRRSPYKPMDGLDDFLLRKAEERGVHIVHERVQQVIFEPLPRVCTGERQQVFDLAVLAIGINATPPVMPDLGYSPPATEAMAQDDLLIESSAGRREMRGTVHVFFDQPQNLIFGALVPKGPFATVSLLGRHLDRTSIQEFIKIDRVVRIVGSQPPQTCGCRPRVAVSPAREYYADRFVAIGDSCVTRLYKDGIGSALLTAQAAATTAIEIGIGRDAFARHYAPVCRAIARDNWAGRMVFNMIALIKRRAFLMRGLGRVLLSERRRTPSNRQFGQTLWALFTGDSNYGEILRMMLMPKSMILLAAATVTEILVRSHTRGRDKVDETQRAGDAAERSG